jgi:hypothetical protein
MLLQIKFVCVCVYVCRSGRCSNVGGVCSAMTQNDAFLDVLWMSNVFMFCNFSFSAILSKKCRTEVKMEDEVSWSCTGLPIRNRMVPTHFTIVFPCPMDRV